MLEPAIITTRDFIRNYKAVLNRVHKTRQPTVVVSHKRPKAAIISLSDFKKLEDFKYKNSANALLQLTQKVRELLKDEELPRDLSIRHDYYLWGRPTK